MSAANSDPAGLPPGLVSYLAGGRDQVGRAFKRTLTSLADRGWLVLTPEDSGASTAGLVRIPARRELPVSEALVLERVRVCSRNMPTVPLSELLSTDGEAYQAWSKRFRHALDEESRAAGLTTRTMPGALTVPFALLVAALSGTVAAVADSANRSSAASGVGFGGLIVGLIMSAFLTAYKPTAAGRQVTAQARAQLDQPDQAWRPADTLAQPADAGTRPVPALSDAAASAAGMARSADEALLSKDGQPLPEGKAWSSFTGRWRVVDVGSFEDGPVREGRPQTLVAGAFYAVVCTVPAALYGLLALKGPAGEALAAAPAALFAVLAVAGWWPRYSRRLAFPRRTVYRGQIVKRWVHDADPGDADVPREFACSVDSGDSDVAHSFRLARDVYKKLGVGDMVQVDYSPRWRKLNGIRRL